jgi:HAD superfamily hydrolase (TIGR01509 family)
MSQAFDPLPAPLPAAVLFDMDGLLIDTEPVWFAVETQILAELGASWLPDDHARLVGSALPVAAEFIAGRAGGSVTGEYVAQLLLERMREPLRTATVLPGVRDLIAELDHVGIPRALVSSSYRVLVEAALAGLAPLTFDAVVAGDEVTHHKPHPEPYLLAASMLDLDPSDCVALEDSPRGADSASAAGCMVIAVPSVAAIAPARRRRVVASVADIDLAYLRSMFD